ncbi:MAG: sterol desaturase family protein [Leptospira sp.]|nr:sterol desaturase family protein [Leptospira sp.]
MEFEWNKALLVFGFGMLFFGLRYVVMAGTAFLIFWKFLYNRLHHRWIQQDRVPEKKKILHEIKYSLLTMVIFGMVGIWIYFMKTQGWTQIYTDFHEYGWGYFLLSLVGIILLHDAYFYWTHRAMHHPKLFKHMHLTHHIPTNPSPWAAFAFHPYEAVVEAGIVPLAVLLFPLHTYTIVAFLFYMTFLNVLGHLGFEMFPKRFLDNVVLRYHNTTTHHNMHHRYFHCNYGLYFNWWDRWMGTNHVNYKERFDEVTNRDKEKQMQIG